MACGKDYMSYSPKALITILSLVYIILLYKDWYNNAEVSKDRLHDKDMQLILEENKKHKNPHNFKYIFNPEDKICGPPISNNKVELLIMVASSLKNADRRRSIRETWGNKHLLERHHMKLIFLVGTTAKADLEQELDLKTEEENYEDLVREDFIDSYQNLTLKTLGGMKWSAMYCPQTEWVMKTDDDMFINIRHLSQHLNSQENSKLIMGCIKNGPQGAPQPIGLEHAPFRSVHPPFTAGAGYVISGDLIQPLYLASLDTKLIRVEDAFLTGYCANKVEGVRREHHQKFSCGQLVSRDCDMKAMLTGHKVTPERMKTIHQKIEKGLC